MVSSAFSGYPGRGPDAAAHLVEHPSIPAKPETRNRNFWLHVSEGTLATFSMEIVSIGVVLPVLAGALGASPSAFGMVTAVAGFASLGPLLFAPRMEAVRRKKMLVLLIGVAMRLPLLAIALALGLLAGTAPLLSLAIVAAMYLAIMLAVHVNAPPWMDLLAETIDESLLGRLMGYRHGLSGVISFFLAGPVCAAVIAAFAFPGNYVTLYLVAFAAGVLSWLLFSRVEEIPAHTTPNDRKPIRVYFRDLLGSVAEDRDYRALLLYRGLSRFAFAAMPFFTLAAVQAYGIGEATAAGVFIPALAAGKIGGNFLFGRLSHRTGHKMILGGGAAVLAAAALLAALAPSGEWYVAVLFLWGLGSAGRSVSDVPFMTAVAPRGRRVGYISLMMVAVTPFAVTAPLVAGNVMETFGHAPLFLGTAACLLLALWPLSRIQLD
jgi:MFS family permease